MKRRLLHLTVFAACALTLVGISVYVIFVPGVELVAGDGGSPITIRLVLGLTSFASAVGLGWLGLVTEVRVITRAWRIRKISTAHAQNLKH